MHHRIFTTSQSDLWPFILCHGYVLRQYGLPCRKTAKFLGAENSILGAGNPTCDTLTKPNIAPVKFSAPKISLVLSLAPKNVPVFYLPLGRYRNCLVRPSGRPAVRPAICNTLFAPFPSSDFHETRRIYWYWVIGRPGNMVLVVRPRSRSQGSTERSKLAYFAHFRELLLGFSSDYHQNWGRCAIWTYKKT